MPAGMAVDQKDIGSPKTVMSIPVARKCAAAARPYGPAPMIEIRNRSHPLVGPQGRLVTPTVTARSAGLRELLGQWQQPPLGARTRLGCPVWLAYV
jgi:hypothetical protein